VLFFNKVEFRYTREKGKAFVSPLPVALSKPNKKFIICTVTWCNYEQGGELPW